MKLFSRHKKFKQNFIRGMCLSATIFQIVALSAYAVEQEYSFSFSEGFTDSNTEVLYDLWDVPNSDITLQSLDSLDLNIVWGWSYSKLFYNGQTVTNPTYQNPSTRLTVYTNFYDEDKNQINGANDYFFMTDYVTGTYSSTQIGTSTFNSSYIRNATYDYTYSSVPSNARYMSFKVYHNVEPSQSSATSSYYGQGALQTFNFTANITGYTSSDRTVIDAVDEQTKVIQDQYQQDQDGASKAGEDAGALVEQAKDLENKWEILWYPIKFTNRVLEVFTGGTQSASYQNDYNMISGYTYDETSGCLIPVIDKTRSARSSGGASITFPAYTLPVLDVQLWDSYTFDLSTVKDSFPVLFDAIYVVSTVLEIYWFVAFLRDKYEEVFGS